MRFPSRLFLLLTGLVIDSRSRFLSLDCLAMLFMGIYALNIVRLNRNKKEQLEAAALGEITLLDGLQVSSLSLENSTASSATRLTFVLARTQDETDFQNPRMVYSI